MAARDEDVPRYTYWLAVCAGLAALPLIYAAAYFLAGDLPGYLVRGSADVYYGRVWEAAVIYFLLHAGLGALFGLLWPEKTWRWGVWLCGVPTLFACFLAPGASAFLKWEALTLLPACLGAYAAGTAHLKFTAVDEEG